MLVGLTYDLRSDYLKEGFGEEETAEFDKEETIEGIENAIKAIGHQTLRIGNIKQLVLFLSSGKRCDIVFNIAEGMYGIGREAQVPALLDAYSIPYVFSDPLVLALTLHKGMTKRIIQNLNLPTPEFAIIQTIADIDKVKIKFPLFAKPIAEGTGKGITSLSKIQNKEELKKVCTDLLIKFKQAVLVEKFLPGREFTVGVIGTGDEAKVIGAMEIVYEEIANHEFYSYENKEHYENYVKYKPVTDKKILKECEKLVLNAWNGLNCKDGGRIDVKIDDTGKISFIEVNPLAGLNPIHSDLVILAKMNGISYNQLIERIFNSAIKRIKIN